ncbi:DUF6286 domain-containing protein [Streptomyces sp. NPDC002057]|uniref:DUF6286 domain-containing Asp23/Gls24 family envelope stress response protein n=1 Tax=Streptomyces sp. NPDC002057 TaxID=3154664 RepID=UPI003326D075
MTAAGYRGTTRVSEKAVRTIAVRAATEALPVGSTPNRASVKVRGGRAHVHLDVRLHRPDALAVTVGDLQEYVAERTRNLTGLHCGRPGVRVTGLTLSSPETPSPSAATATTASGTAATPRTPRRRWSQRRLPAAILSLAGSTAFGAVALDVSRVRFQGRPAAAWRRTLVSWAADIETEPLVSALAAGSALVAGVLLMLVALLPGHRRRWTISSAPALSASVDRTVVETLLRDAVGAVSGIGPVTVRVSRRTAAVRATLTFGDQEAALAEAQHAAHQALATCRLARPPRLRLSVHSATSDVPLPGDRSAPQPSGPSLAPGPSPAPVPAPGSASARFHAPRTPKDDTPPITIHEGADL